MIALTLFLIHTRVTAEGNGSSSLRPFYMRSNVESECLFDIFSLIIVRS
jgi:hypothetical protein